MLKSMVAKSWDKMVSEFGEDIYRVRWLESIEDDIVVVSVFSVLLCLQELMEVIGGTSKTH